MKYARAILAVEIAIAGAVALATSGCGSSGGLPPVAAKPTAPGGGTPAGTVQGRAMYHKQPLGRAKVKVVSPGKVVVASGEADSQGNFNIVGVPSGPEEIDVSGMNAVGGAVSGSSMVEVQDGTTTQAEVDTVDSLAGNQVGPNDQMGSQSQSDAMTGEKSSDGETSASGPDTDTQNVQEGSQSGLNDASAPVSNTPAKN